MLIIVEHCYNQLNHHRIVAEEEPMDTLEFIKDISWQVVILAGLIVLLVYKKPLGSLISNLRKGSISSKKGEGVSVDLEMEHSTSMPLGTDVVRINLMEQQASEDIVKAESFTIEKEEQKEIVVSWYELSLQGEYQKARDALLETIKELELLDNADDGYFMWLKLKAATFLSKYDYVKGKEEFEALVRNNPDKLPYCLGYIELLYNSGDADRVNSLIDNYAGNKSNKYGLLFEKANYLYKSSDIDKATAIIDELNLQNDNLLIKARAHILKGEILKKDKPEDAKKWFIRAYKVVPTNESILEAVAELFAEMNEFKLLLFLRKQQIELDNKSIGSWGNLGNAYLTMNMYSHSMDAYEKANELSSKSPQWITANIGNLYNNAKLYSKAIEFLNLAMTMDSSNEYTANRLASALSNNEKEEKEIQKAMEETRILIAKIDKEQENLPALIVDK